MDNCRTGVVFLTLALLAWLAAPWGASSARAANTLIWSYGLADDSFAEFFNGYNTANPEAVVVGTTPANAISKGLSATKNPSMTITYNLASVPSNGALFTFKLLSAHEAGPEMAVFSNNTMMGLIQLWGVGGSVMPYAWKKTYQLYIPKEFLKSGSNVLTLKAPRPTWCATGMNTYLWWVWDYLKLESLGDPATEPIHGKATYLGTQFDAGVSIDNNMVTMAQPLLEWLGIAYSGNTMRAPFWSNDAFMQPNRLQYLQKLRDLNMTVMVENLSGQVATLNGSSLDATSQGVLDNFFASYGTLFQYYEVDNEPGCCPGYITETTDVAMAQYANSIRPATVKITAPGWSFWPTGGVPSGWESQPAQRMNVETYCQAINGHSYGYSYADISPPAQTDGSFMANLASYGPLADGWPKEMVVTETGTSNYHTDGSAFSSSQPHASCFDRTLRAHVAVSDRTMQFAIYFPSGTDYSLINNPSNWSDPSTLTAFPPVSPETDSRIKTFRRLALAYATHGAPLTYTYLNQAAIAGLKVYFRGVNTSTLAPLAGSGGTSNKVLLNFVNFEGSAQTMQVRVTMPWAGNYAGTRIGPGDTYSATHTTVNLNAQPTLDITENLGARESVQYILVLPPPTSPTVTPSFTATRTPTPAGTATDTPTATPSRTATPTFSGSPTWSNTLSPSFSPTITPTPTLSPSFSSSPTFSATPSVTPTLTISDTFTISPTVSVTPTFSLSPSITPTATISPPVNTAGSGELLRAFFVPNPSDGRNLCLCYKVSGQTGPVRVRLYTAALTCVFDLLIDSQAGDAAGWRVEHLPLTALLANGAYFATVEAAGNKILAKLAILK